MKRKYTWHSFLVVPFLLGLLFIAGSMEINAATVYGVTSSNQLVRFDTASPGNVTTVGAISGLQESERIIGIDFRPANGQIYGLSNKSRIYRINKVSAVPTLIGALTTQLVGTSFGFDFNPVADRIRIVSDADQNLRANPDTGTNVVDGTLMYSPNDISALLNPTVTGAAYTNSVANATSTTLYDIDSGTDSLVIQNPANSGMLQTVGLLGVDVTNVVGFDHSATSNIAYASLNVGGSLGFYTINLQTGLATRIGTLGNQNITDVTLDIRFAAANNRLDFDGNGRADYAVFRPSNSNWLLLKEDGTINQFQFGNSNTDFLQPQDYDGDGITDVAVWRRTTGTWYIAQSSTGTVRILQFGSNGDEPVARDYDGDGKADLAVVRRTGGQMIWYIFQSLTGTPRIEQFGLASDIVAPGDYDGDGRFDLATFRGDAGASAVFYVKGSTAGFSATQWGLGSDLVAPGDYDGDGKTDYAVVRQGSPYVWYILRSSDNSFTIVSHGTKPHDVAQNDYDGDGKTDIAVYDPISATFFVLSSRDGSLVRTQLGQTGDYPVANYDVH